MASSYPEDSQNITIVFMDGHSSGALDDAWRVLFGSQPVYVSALSASPTCWHCSVLVPPGYTSGLSVDSMTLADPCRDIAHVRDFSNWVVRQYSLSSIQAPPRDHHPEIVFVMRRDYDAHPRGLGQAATRKIANEGEIIERVSAVFPDTVVKIVLFERMQIRDQISSIRGATVVVGVHGAGLSHILFANGVDTPLIELVPPEYEGRRHFAMFAQYIGAGYERVGIGADRGDGTHHVPVTDLVDSVRRALKSV